MNNSKVILEVLRRIMKKAIVENAPARAPEKPQQEPGTKERPKTPSEPKKPRRDVGKPDKTTIPKEIPHKATVKENDMLKKIETRYKSRKK